jgi:hypothetical protein
MRTTSSGIARTDGPIRTTSDGIARTGGPIHALSVEPPQGATIVADKSAQTLTPGDVTLTLTAGTERKPEQHHARGVRYRCDGSGLGGLVR